MNPPELIEVARLHLELGRSLLPVAANKRPYDDALKATGHTRLNPEGQLKASWKPLQDAAATLEMVQEWLRFRGCGLGLIGGAVSGVVIIDADHGGGTEKFDSWGLSARAHVQTISGGLHWYVRHPGWKVRTAQSHTGQALALIQGVDIRADGGYAVIPPSSFPRGRYTALRNPRVLDSAELLPEAVRALLNLDAPPPAARPTIHTVGDATLSPVQAEAGPAESTDQSQFELPAPGQRWTGKDGQGLESELLYRALTRANSGASRDETGFLLAKQLRDNRFDFAEARSLMLRYQEQAPDISAKGLTDPYTVQQAMVNLEQAYSRAARQPWGLRRVKPRPEPPQTVSAALAQTWALLCAAERQEAARCACHLRGAERGLALDFLTTRGIDTATLQRAEQERRRQGLATPGTATLWRLLRGAQARGQIHILEHVQDD